MEHKSRKMFAAIAVIMLCAVAIVGVGYAYTASTQNGGNTVQSEYVTLIQTNGTDAGTQGAYTFLTETSEIEWNTTDTITPADDTKHRTIFTFADPVSTPSSEYTGYTICQIGESFKVETKQINGSDTTLNCAITTDFTYDAHLALFVEVTVDSTKTVMKLCSTGEAPSQVTSLKKYTTDDFDGNNEYAIAKVSGTTESVFKEATVKVFYGYLTSEGGIIVDSAIGTHATVPTLTEVAKSLTFTITAPTPVPAP